MEYNEYEQAMVDMGCPDCDGDIELYNTNESGTGGNYRCVNCGRDTVWAVGKAESIQEVIKRVFGI